MTNVLPALIFRTATEADVDAVVTLVQSAYRGESGRSGWTTESDLLDGQRTDAGPFSGMKLIGFASVATSPSGAAAWAIFHASQSK